MYFLVPIQLLSHILSSSSCVGGASLVAHARRSTLALSFMDDITVDLIDVDSDFGVVSGSSARSSMVSTGRVGGCSSSGTSFPSLEDITVDEVDVGNVAPIVLPAPGALRVPTRFPPLAAWLGPVGPWMSVGMPVE